MDGILIVIANMIGVQYIQSIVPPPVGEQLYTLENPELIFTLEDSIPIFVLEA